MPEEARRRSLRVAAHVRPSSPLRMKGRVRPQVVNVPVGGGWMASTRTFFVGARFECLFEPLQNSERLTQEWIFIACKLFHVRSEYQMSANSATDLSSCSIISLTTGLRKSRFMLAKAVLSLAQSAAPRGHRPSMFLPRTFGQRVPVAAPPRRCTLHRRRPL